MKETLYIYTRVSTSMQKEDGTGLAEQKRLGVERAKQLNMEPLILDEGSMSGSGEDIEQRPVLSNLIALIRKGEVKNLYVYNGDRLARHSLTSAIINHDIVENGVTVHTHFGTYTDTPQDQLMMDLVGVFAKYENKVRTARLKSGRFAKAKEGKWMLGKPLFGYGLDKEGRLKVDKVQGDYVKQMFEWFDGGIGITEIAKMLDGKIKTPGNKVLWSGQSVRNILTHTHYKGFYTYLGLTINCQTIVSPQIWESVNKNLANRKTRSKSVGVKKYDYLLRPIMSCGDCGSVYHGESKKRRGEYRYSYVCSSRDKSYKKKIAKGDWKRGKYCKNTVSIESERMEDIVWECLSNILKTSHQEKSKFKDLSLSSKKKGTFKAKEKKKLEREIVAISNTIKRLDLAIIKNEKDKVILPNKAKELAKLNTELESAKNIEMQKMQNFQNQLHQLENDDRWIDWVNDYSERMVDLDSMDRKEKNEVVMKYVDKIDVSFNESERTHNIKLKLKLPLIADGFKWKDERKKSQGYIISEGSYEKDIELPTFAKNVGK